jgi:bacterioferritin
LEGIVLNKKEIIDKMNKMLAQEHACAIRYATHAACISGPYAELVAERLKEISADEVLHAELIRQRILALQGIPTMDVAEADLIYASELEKILDINIREEKQAIEEYKDLIKNIPHDEVILYQTIQDIIRDEEEHLEELINLQ